MLKIIEGLYADPLGKNPKIGLFLKEFTNVLESYKQLDSKKFIELVSLALSNQKSSNKLRKDSIVSQIKNLAEISLDELKDLLSKDLTKLDLLEIINKRLGVPIGNLKKSKIDEIRREIDKVIENIETLEIIGKRAGE